MDRDRQILLCKSLPTGVEMTEEEDDDDDEEEDFVLSVVKSF
jgi:hypothetical protein